MNYTSIKNWAEEDRPREKLILRGSHTLTDSELLAILIGSGTRKQTALDLSREIILKCESDITQLSKMEIRDLIQISGIGEAKASKLMASFELMKRVQYKPSKERSTIRSSKDAFEQVQFHFLDLGHEEFYVIFLNRGNQVISKELISKGGLSGTIADGKVIFKKALELRASALILTHNHPSGQLRPSEQDKRLTRQLTDFGKLIDLQILDHLIVSQDNYFSFADEGMM